MPANQPPRIYWDACVFLDYVEATPGRIIVLDELVARAEKGEIRLLTSTISRVEVAYGSDADSDKRIDELWAAASPVTLIEFYDGVALEARRLIRAAKEKDLKLTPLDAIHIASASLKATEMHTYDERLPRHSADAHIPIHKPTTPQLPLSAAVEAVDANG